MTSTGSVIASWLSLAEQAPADTLSISVNDFNRVAAAICTDLDSQSIPSWVFPAWAKFMMPVEAYQRLRVMPAQPRLVALISPSTQQTVSAAFEHLNDSRAIQLLVAWELALTERPGDPSRQLLEETFGNGGKFLQKPFIVQAVKFVQLLREPDDPIKVAENAAFDLLSPKVRSVAYGLLRERSRSQILSLEALQYERLSPDLSSSTISTSEYRELFLTNTYALACRMYFESTLKPYLSFFAQLEKKHNHARGLPQAKANALWAASIEVSKVGSIYFGLYVQTLSEQLDAKDVERLNSAPGDQSQIQQWCKATRTEMQTQIPLMMIRLSQMWSTLHKNLGSGAWQEGATCSYLFPNGLLKATPVGTAELEEFFNHSTFNDYFEIPQAGSEEDLQATGSNLVNYLRYHPRFASAWTISGSNDGNAAPLFANRAADTPEDIKNRLPGHVPTPKDVPHPWAHSATPADSFPSATTPAATVSNLPRMVPLSRDESPSIALLTAEERKVRRAGDEVPLFAASIPTSAPSNSGYKPQDKTWYETNLSEPLAPPTTPVASSTNGPAASRNFKPLPTRRGRR